MKARFGRYIFLERLAAGGMAEVFLARRVSFGGFAKFVVIKRLLPSLTGQRAYERLFLREARMGALLNHPNIVSLYDLGQLDDIYFMAMEYIDGASTADVMIRAAQREQPIPLGAALRIVGAVAAGLQHAHFSLDLEGQPLGIIHHDVSPHNIQLRWDGGVKLIDFGVATRIGRSKAKGRRGKYAYMSPELLERRGDIDHRGDVFSLGVVLYELTTGRRLFKGDSDEATLEKASLGQVPLPRDLDPSYPEPLQAVVLEALARDRAARIQTAGELRRALARVASEEGLDDHPEALADYLARLFGDEIEARQAELRHLAQTTDPRRADRQQADPQQDDPQQDDPQQDDPQQDDPQQDDPQQADLRQDDLRAGEPAPPALTGEPPPASTEPEPPARRPMLRANALWLMLLAIAAGAGWWLGQRPSPISGSMVITSRPDGARVFVGDRLLGITPIEAPDMALGTRLQLRMVREGFQTWRGTVTIDAARPHQTLHVALMPADQPP